MQRLLAAVLIVLAATLGGCAASPSRPASPSTSIQGQDPCAYDRAVLRKVLTERNGRTYVVDEELDDARADLEYCVEVNHLELDDPWAQTTTTALTPTTIAAGQGTPEDIEDWTAACLAEANSRDRPWTAAERALVRADCEDARRRAFAPEKDECFLPSACVTDPERLRRRHPGHRFKSTYPPEGPDPVDPPAKPDPPDQPAPDPPDPPDPQP